MEETKIDEGGLDTLRLVHFNVSGRVFSTRFQTLAAFPESFLCVLVDGRFPCADLDSNGYFFIDRPWKPFEIIVTYLQTGKLYLPESCVEQRLVFDEAEFYGIPLQGPPRKMDRDCWTLKMHSKNVVIGDGGLSAKLLSTSRQQNGFIVGSCAFQNNAKWQVKFGQLKGWIMVGVLDSQANVSQFNFSYGSVGSFGVSNTGQVYENGKLTTAPPSTEDQSSNCFSEADILLVELDMAQGKLLITTVSSSPEESTIPQQRWECSGLSPGRSYFPHFNMLGPTGDRFTIDR
eukprot:TRINITY_DN4282_c0_g1_i2.p1 TRINITY_DN4282_c0_g1~~TRINITY_DN4282_c0_g1_i2.p1  ORF type:complete len:300 (+),score=53.96 TRINITY_DN4282_c0_g1_i2:35-901(+)